MPAIEIEASASRVGSGADIAVASPDDRFVPKMLTQQPGETVAVFDAAFKTAEITGCAEAPPGSKPAQTRKLSTCVFMTRPPFTVKPNRAKNLNRTVPVSPLDLFCLASSMRHADKGECGSLYRKTNSFAISQMEYECPQFPSICPLETKVQI
jgi:hypothetical protein